MKRITFLSILFSILFISLKAQESVSYEQAFPNLSFEFPVEIQNANDGSNRMFIVEQSGRIKVFENDKNTSQQTTFLDLRGHVSYSAGQEIGLLGLAFHPNYKQNGYFYVYHATYNGSNNFFVEIVLERYRVSSSDPNKADPSSRLKVFGFNKNLDSSNHNGGKIAFGPDEYLYISLGDGGGSADPYKNAQNLDIAFGSLLRIDVDIDGNNPKAANGNYEIPNDNPRVGKSGMDEIYAWGFRNTWKFSFDSQNDRIWGADVGQFDYEEINLIEKGGNYGWNRYEANSVENASTNLTTSPDIKPTFYYDHANGDASITGGYVYRGSSNNPVIQGKYVYGDYLSGRVWALDYNATNNTATSQLLFRTNGEYVSSFGLDELGELYFSSYGNAAKIYKIVGGDVDTAPTTTAVNGVGDWKDLENGTNGVVESVVVSGDDVFVAGSFSQAGLVSANNIAVYDKIDGWKALSSGANGKVNTLAVAPDGTIYAGGEFTSMGGVSALNIAMWNGSSWSALGSGTDGPVAKIGVDSKNKVYVGGGFVTAGGETVNNIALWNNGTWSSLTDTTNAVPGTNNEIRAIAFDENDVLYVGGNFDTAGGNSAPRIATWNGTTWGTLGEGTSGFVQAIEVTSSNIYVGGNFSIAGKKTVNRIARWVRSSKNWETLGNGVSGNVNDLKYVAPYLYVVGNFETVAKDAETNYTVKNGARWSFAQGWQALGPSKNVGLDNAVNSIAVSDKQERLYVGGSFDLAGQSNADNVAVWGRSFDCQDERLKVEYRLDEGSWIDGEEGIFTEIGAKVALRLSGSIQNYIISHPDGSETTGESNLGEVSSAQVGKYVFTSSGGCSKALDITIANENPECDAVIIPEYKINGLWQSGSDTITVNTGSDVTLSMLPNGIGLNITLPDGSIVGDNYALTNITPASNGTYILTSEDGCTQNFSIAIEEDCVSGTIIPEYRLDGEWYFGKNDITVDEGTDVMLSMLPNGNNLTITLPNGIVVGDNYALGKVTLAHSGAYIIRSLGCTEIINLEVTDISNCSGQSAIPEYRINGFWNSGQKYLQIEEGETITLSMLPNGVGLSITLPNGQKVGDNYVINNISQADSGIYLLEPSRGCKSTIELFVTKNGTSKSIGLDSSAMGGADRTSRNLVVAYPNPTTDKVFVDLNGMVQSEPLELIIYDMEQRRLFSEKLGEGQPKTIELDFGGYSNGIYFISIPLANGEFFTEKIIKSD